MSIIKLFRNYFEYNLWANRRLLRDLDAFSAVYNDTLPISFGSIHKLLSHTHYYDVKAYKVVVEKREEASIVIPSSQKKLFDSIHCYSHKWLRWAERLPNDNLTEAYDLNLVNIITSLYNHGVYHRGQVTAVLSMLGYEPTSLDVYIFDAG